MPRGSRGEDLLPAAQFCVRVIRRLDEAAEHVRRMFRDRNGSVPVIGKVLRGRNVRRLLYYLYGPGQANEHTDPHLVAGFDDPAELEPERRPDGTRDFRRLTGLLEQPLVAVAGSGYDKPVWHCAIRAAPEDPTLSEGEWGRDRAACSWGSRFIRFLRPRVR